MKPAAIWMSIVALSIGAYGAEGNRSDDLYAAVRTNNLARLRALVQSPADANTKDQGGQTPLMYAAAAGSIDAMKFLLGKGADVNAQSASGLTPLILGATARGRTPVLAAR